MATAGPAFASDFDHAAKQAWMAAHWTLSPAFSALYLLLIFAGRRWMRPRPSLELRVPLVAWNLALAAFSAAGAWRTLPELERSLRRFGLSRSACEAGFFAGVPGLWTWLFALSKLPELADTAFLVLRKRPVRFLHWYHHATVLCYCWYSYGGRATTGLWFVAMNYAVHALMYSYFALRAMRAPLPAVAGAVVTALQLAQMVVGCCVNWWAYSAKAAGEPCGVSGENLVVSAVMYASYMALFAHLFYATYVKRPRNRKTE